MGDCQGRIHTQLDLSRQGANTRPSPAQVQARLRRTLKASRWFVSCRAVSDELPNCLSTAAVTCNLRYAAPVQQKGVEKVSVTCKAAARSCSFNEYWWVYAAQNNTHVTLLLEAPHEVELPHESTGLSAPRGGFFRRRISNRWKVSITHIASIRLFSILRCGVPFSKEAGPARPSTLSRARRQRRKESQAGEAAALGVLTAGVVAELRETLKSLGAGQKASSAFPTRTWPPERPSLPGGTHSKPLCKHGSTSPSAGRLRARAASRLFGRSRSLDASSADAVT